MTLDEDLVELVDKVARKLRTTRSAFTREALKEAVRKYTVLRLERKHRRGYELRPPSAMEFSVWEDEQKWGGE